MTMIFMYSTIDHVLYQWLPNKLIYLSISLNEIYSIPLREITVLTNCGQTDKLADKLAEKLEV